jgi:Pyridine nucleotide-disulphide oxidoreductase
VADSAENIAEILRRMNVPGSPSLFVLGGRAQRVTILSQQHRAFNLVYALRESGRLTPGTRVAVVGGGIGGLTIAAGLLMVQCDVHVFERWDELIMVQRTNHTRYLHPNLYEWPAGEPENYATDLPCMNWQADQSNNVARQLIVRWAAIERRVGDRLKVFLRTAITGIARFEGKPILRTSSTNWTRPYDYVVLAVGFGAERGLSNLNSTTYWQNDNLDSDDLRRGGQPWRVLVSGCGDGGYVDTLRLMIRDFDHAGFAERFSRDPQLRALQDELLTIERAATVITEDASIFFDQKYQLLDLPVDFIERMGGLRRYTSVTLNGRAATPLSLNTSILNRLALFALHHDGHLKYLQGELDNGATTHLGKTCRVVFVGNPQIHDFDEVVVRHGPDPELKGCFPDVWGSIDREQLNADDPTRDRLYPQNYFAHWEASPPVPLVRLPRTDLARVIHPLMADPGTNSIASVVTVEVGISAQSASVEDHESVDRTALKLANDISRALRRKNHRAAVEAAIQLDTVILEKHALLSASAAQQAIMSLLEVEAMKRERVAAEGHAYDPSRAQLLLQRLHNVL